MIRLALVGCGAIARRRHLPAVTAHPDVELVALVDADQERGKALRAAHGLACEVFDDFRALRGQVDAVINALPNQLHTPVNLFFLQDRVHVLCEKPLATTSADARLCYEAAERHGVVLAAALHWRFHQSTQLLRLVLAEGMLGIPLDYDWEYGVPYDWPSASGFYCSRAQPGGGLLFDQGVHLLDCLLDWFGPATAVAFASDDWGGGVEANAQLTLQHHGRYGAVRGRVRLSNIYTLKNRLAVLGPRSRAEIHRADPGTLVFYREVGGQEVSMSLRQPDARADQDPFFRQLDHFIESVKGKRNPEVDARHASATIELIERCYEQATRLAEPWSYVPGMPDPAQP